jgi:mannose PTS system EIIA component
VWFLHRANAARVAGTHRLDSTADNRWIMPGLLIIAHAPLASSLKEVASHTFPDCHCRLEVLDVPADMPVEEVEARARELLARVRNPDALIFTDVFGATPCNVAQRVASSVDGGQVKVIAGINVPMLWRSLCYGNESLDTLVTRALAGATQGVMQVASVRPQNQACKPAANDQDPHHHQQ